MSFADRMDKLHGVDKNKEEKKSKDKKPKDKPKEKKGGRG